MISIHTIHLGIAPYIGEYGDIHTWFMIKIDHTPEFDRNLVFTPHIRFFKNVHLVEVGADTKGKSCLTMFLDIRKGMFMKKLILFIVVFCAIYRNSSADDKSLTVYAYVNGLV